MGCVCVRTRAARVSAVLSVGGAKLRKDTSQDFSTNLGFVDECEKVNFAIRDGGCIVYVL